MLNLRAPTLLDSLVARLLMVTKFNKTAFGSETMVKITFLGIVDRATYFCPAIVMNNKLVSIIKGILFLFFF